MELGLTRVDLLQVGLTMPKTTRLLPSGATFGDKSFQQKVAVGDKDGVLQVFSSKKGEIHHSFKTLPGSVPTMVEFHSMAS